MSTVDVNHVIVTGENSVIRLNNADNDAFTTHASFWRILTSPAGSGDVLYLKSELTDDRWRIYSDNIAMARWLQSTGWVRSVPSFSTPQSRLPTRSSANPVTRVIFGPSISLRAMNGSRLRGINWVSHFWSTPNRIACRAVLTGCAQCSSRRWVHGSLATELRRKAGPGQGIAKVAPLAPVCWDYAKAGRRPDRRSRRPHVGGRCSRRHTAYRELRARDDCDRDAHYWAPPRTEPDVRHSRIPAPTSEVRRSAGLATDEGCVALAAAGLIRSHPVRSF
jgi:hypothetical protein